MASRKVKGIDDRTSAGEITISSEGVFQVRTHRMQNVSYAQEKEREELFFSRIDSGYFRQPRLKSEVHVVFNNANKEFVESIYDSRWDLIYSKY